MGQRSDETKALPGTADSLVYLKHATWLLTCFHHVQEPLFGISNLQKANMSSSPVMRDCARLLSGTKA